ncbi:MAG TPA: hypothetical protein VEO54_08425 [Thermoanaerobaculia bacterium]|nr:hypothetical protein [Thermoanaerobaculia bacterium]
MAKNRATAEAHRNGAPRNEKSGVRRVILFPTEPSTIGDRKIDRAIERVVSRKK